MNTQHLNGCLKWLANQLSKFYVDETLPDELRCKLDVFYDSINRYIDWDCLKQQDVKDLGFLRLEDDIWFIPLWLYPVVPEGLTVYDINGCSFEYHRETASNEVMYGHLTFGVILDEIEKNENV